MIEYVKQHIKTIQTVYVHTDSPEDNTKAVEYLESLGFNLLSMGMKQPGEGYRITFHRDTLVAATERGDKIALDGRYTLADPKKGDTA